MPGVSTLDQVLFSGVILVSGQKCCLLKGLDPPFSDMLYWWAINSSNSTV